MTSCMRTRRAVGLMGLVTKTFLVTILHNSKQSVKFLITSRKFCGQKTLVCRIRAPIHWDEGHHVKQNNRGKTHTQNLSLIIQISECKSKDIGSMNEKNYDKKTAHKISPIMRPFVWMNVIWMIEWMIAWMHELLHDGMIHDMPCMASTSFDLLKTMNLCCF